MLRIIKVPPHRVEGMADNSFCLKAPEVKVSQPEVKEEIPAAVPAKEEPAAVLASPEPEPSSSSPSPSPPDETLLKKHEPHLGPKPRSHNKVLNPPGGKSSVVFYWAAKHHLCLCPYTLSSPHFILLSFQHASLHGYFTCTTTHRLGVFLNTRFLI